MTDGPGTSLKKYEIAQEIADMLERPADRLGLHKLNMQETLNLRHAVKTMHDHLRNAI